MEAAAGIGLTALGQPLTNRSSRAHSPWVILQADGRLLIYQVLEGVGVALSDLADRFRSLGHTDIEQFVATGQEENLHLEFKTLGGPGFRSEDDRRNLARALSGFANSDGGMVIWGMVANKTGDGVDCAKELRPVADIRALLARLNELTSDALSPIVSGIEHRVVHEYQDGSGLAATLVPASDGGPHMAKMGVDQYYKRSGDSFVRMEHFDIADMFGRRPHPVLTFHLAVQASGGESTGGVRSRTFRVLGVIKNTGRGSAIAPYLAVDVHPPYEVSQWGVDGNGTHGLPVMRRGGSVGQFGASTAVALHPGVCIEVFGINGSYEVDHPLVADLAIDYELGAADLPLFTSTVLIPGSKIIEIVQQSPSPF